MNIIQAIRDPLLFRDFLADGDGDLNSWGAWSHALRVLYGLPVREAAHPLIRQCTGRDPARLPDIGFEMALFLTGRRSGKSRIAAVIGAFEAVLAGHEVKLARGEKGVVGVLAPVVRQGRIVRDYIRAVFDIPMLHTQLAEETKEGFELTNGVRIEILAGDWRHARGYTLLAAIVDEIAFFGLDEESKIRSDTELIRAIKPSLATVGGKLIAISSPHARKGWCYRTYERNFGNDSGSILVWNCPSRTMNPRLPQAVIDQALAEDLAAARSEFLAEWRDDVGEFLPRHVIERLVIEGRRELLPQADTRYCAFCDVSGGRGDDAALAIAHRAGRSVVVDYLRRWRPPFDPREVIGAMSQDLRRYGVRRAYGDAFGAEFTSQAFADCGIRYDKSDKNKNELYVELLPRICSGEVELLDDDVLVAQLAALERRTRSGGKDVIDHPSGAHDDCANALAGVCDVAATKNVRVGALLSQPNG